jgi:CubicO group peptidase (beta-lactamase class C family)
MTAHRKFRGVIMFRRVFSCFFVFVFVVSSIEAGIFDWFSSLTPRAQKAKNALQGLDPVIEKALREYAVPGLAIGIVVDGQVIYTKGYGYRDLETKKPVTPDTLFAIGSCTKAFTSFLAGTFVDEGTFNWDSRILDLQPDFRLFDDYATQHMTMRDLLTHRSGMPRHDYMWYNSQMSRPQLMQRLRYLEPANELRECYNYNNLMYLTAGYVMEEMSGKSWETLVADRIFKPLNMKSSNFTIEAMQKTSDYAFPYLEKENRLVRMASRDISIIGPAASINSNVTDLMNWVEMQLNQGLYKNKPLISTSTLQEMHSPQVVVSGTPEHKEAVLSTYGIGWGVLSYRGHYYVSHDGGTNGSTSVVGLLPNEGVGVVVLANKNLTTLPRVISLEIIDRVLELSPIDWYQEGLDMYVKAKESQQELKLREAVNRKKNTQPSHLLDDYTGQFEHPGYGTVEIQKTGEELSLTFNHITSSLNHWHYDMFVVSEESEDFLFSRIGTKLTFRTDFNGDVDELVIPFEPGSADVIFKKKPSDTFGTFSYLQKFVGLYQIYGITVEIAVRDQHLIAIIPGQPLFELIPNTENEFIVKSKTGYTVQFILDANQVIQEVLLVQPYGAFSAKPKR